MTTLITAAKETKGIQNPTKDRIPLKKNQESSTWNLEPMAWNPESKAVFDRQEKRHVSSLKSVAHILSGRGRHYLQNFCGSFDKILPGL